MERQNNAAILIVTGPSGAGKTTIARALIKEVPSPAVLLPADYFWFFIEQGLVTPHLPDARAQNATVISAVAAAANAYALGGYFVLLDGVIGPWHLDVVRRAVTVPLHYVVLRPGIDATITRAAHRGDGLSLTNDELPLTVIRHIHARFADLGQFESHVIDSTSLSEANTVIAVLQTLVAGSWLLPPTHQC